MKSVSFLLRLEVWFIILTIAYFILASAGLGMMLCYDDCPAGASHIYGTWYTNLIGLFVPIGPNNGSIFTFSVGVWLRTVSPTIINLSFFAIYLLIGFFATQYIDTFLGKKLSKRYQSPILKIGVNLLVLMSLTFLIDMTFFHQWASMLLLLHSF